MAIAANYDLSRVRRLPIELLRKMFPKACYVVTGSRFVRTGGYRAVQDDSDPDRTRLVPNGKRVNGGGRRFMCDAAARAYGDRLFGSSAHYTVSVLIPEIDCPGE